MSSRPVSPINYDSKKDSDDRDNARFAVILAAMAYKSQPEIEQELELVGYASTNLLCFRTRLSSGFITEWDDVIAIAFKGSSNLFEWINNLKFWFTSTPYGRIHAGFYQTIEHVGPAVYRVILPGLLSGSRIVVTGHSRGGPLAMLFTALLALNGHKAHAVYTFGSPRFCDEKFARMFVDHD